MDTSSTKPNTTDKKAIFLHDTKHLLEQREVHEKGVFHANYEGKGFFGSIGQFFKNIKLSFEKKDMGKLAKVLTEEFSNYQNEFKIQGRASTGIDKDRIERLKQLQTDISIIKSHLLVMASQCSPKEKSGSEIQSGSKKIGNDSEGYKILWSAVKRFEGLEKEITNKYKELKDK